VDQAAIKNILRQHFPIFQQDELLTTLAEKSTYLEVPADQVLFEQGSYIEIIPLIIEGSVKVLRQENGKDIFLYFISSGESCAMTLSACMKRERSKIIAQSEEATKLIAIPVAAVYELVRKFPSWQDFIIDTYSKRFEEVLHALDQVAFHRMDDRLIHYLQERSKALNSTELNISHQKIADDLATSREVISRLLKQMERNGLIALSRSKLTLLNPK